MKNYSDMISAANNGKVTEFGRQFNAAMAEIVTAKLNAVKVDIASEIRIDGEVDLEDSAND
jgi:hypothetical protein